MLTTLSFVSVVVLIVLWNSREGSWFSLRAQQARDAVVWFDLLWAGEDPAPLSKERAKNAHSLINWFKDGQFPDRPEPIAQAMVPYSPTTGQKEQVKALVLDHAVTLNRNRYQRVVGFELPMLGVVCDVNDLGFLSGLAFLFLLVWLRAALAREFDNYDLTFQIARSDDKRGSPKGSLLYNVYHELAVRQVLSRPRIPGRPGEKFWEQVPLMLIVLPLCIHAFVYAHDYRTVHVGALVNSGATNRSMILSTGVLVLVGAATYQCARQYLALHRLWNETFGILGGPQESRSSQRFPE